ncbi:serine/threonine-protein kinase [Streptomyces sp. NPDC054874]
MQPLTPDDPSEMGPYRLLGVLGEGGMGRVYLARSAGGRTVAVKVVRAEFAGQDDFRQRFAREVDAVRRVGGGWTAPVLDFDTGAETPWVATGYVPGPDLRSVVTEHGPLPEHSLRVLAHRLALALEAVHGAGLVHRDLKPSNVLVTVDGPRVIDFGIARALHAVSGDSFRTRTGAIIGSPGFMSPEQVRGFEVGPQSDVFSLGSVLAYAATGRVPFGNPDIGLHAQMFRVAEEEPDLEGVPESMLGLVRRCLEKTPEKRPTPTELAPRPGAEETAGPWLPGEVLDQLGRHAAQLLDLDPQVRTPVEPVRTDKAQKALPDANPAAPPARPGTRRRAKRTAVLGMVATVLALSVGTLIKMAPWDDKGTASGTDSGKNGAPAPVTVPKQFLGAWEGEMPGHTYIRVELEKDEQGRPVARSSSVRLRAMRGGSYCAETKEVKAASPALLSLGEARSKDAFSSSACEPLPSYSLKPGEEDGTLDFTTEDGRFRGALHKARAGRTPVPEKFLGQWVPMGEGDTWSTRLTIGQVKPGKVFVQGVDHSTGKICLWKEVLAAVDDYSVISSPAERPGEPLTSCGKAAVLTRSYHVDDDEDVLYMWQPDGDDRQNQRQYVRLPRG